MESFEKKSNNSTRTDGIYNIPFNEVAAALEIDSLTRDKSLHGNPTLCEVEFLELMQFS